MDLPESRQIDFFGDLEQTIGVKRALGDVREGQWNELQYRPGPQAVEGGEPPSGHDLAVFVRYPRLSTHRPAKQLRGATQKDSTCGEVRLLYVTF